MVSSTKISPIRPTEPQIQKSYETCKPTLLAEIGTDYNFKHEIVWFNAIGFLLLHLAGIYGFYLCFHASGYTTLYGKLIIKFSLTITLPFSKDE